MEITAKYFAEKTGYEPIDDDLERCNCKQAGEVGHICCGWCPVHNLPVFQCGCINQKNIEKAIENRNKRSGAS